MRGQQRLHKLAVEKRQLNPLFRLSCQKSLTSTYVAHNAVYRFYITVARQFRLPELTRWIALEKDNEDRGQVQKDLRIRVVSPLLLPALRLQRCGAGIEAYR